MGKRAKPDSSSVPEFEDPGILADDSSGDDDSEDFSNEPGSTPELGTDAAGGLGDSDLDAGFDADAKSPSGDDEDEARDENAAAAAAGAGAAAGFDSDPDLDEEGGSSGSGSSSSGSEDDSAGEGEEAEEGEDMDDEDDDDEAAADGQQGKQQLQQHASFLEGGKSASFAKAFAKIMGKPNKAAAAAPAKAGDVILSESASLAKRKAEVAADESAAREAKKQRLEMKVRGHLKVPSKGSDPAHDVREKQLLKLATRGVVLLFNAVNKAQKQKKESEAAGSKGAKAQKLSKSGFFAELKAGAKAVTAAAAGEQLVPGGPGGSAAAAAGRKGLTQQQEQQLQQHRGSGAGWEVLEEGFPGLTGGVKMKDWDKAAAGSDEELNGQALAGSDDEGDSGDEGW